MSSDDDLDYGSGIPQGEMDYSDMDSPGVQRMNSKPIQNQPHDEEVVISDDDDGSDWEGAPPGGGGGGGGRGGGGFNDESMEEMGAAPQARMDSPPGQYDDESDPDPYAGMGGPQSGGAMVMDNDGGAARGGGLDDGGEEDGPRAEGEYNPAEFAHLDVGDDVKELFQYIGRYKPRPHQLDSKLKCFIPEFIPAVGDIDEFIKVPRPDGKQDFLGLRVLDEPATVQSDPTVLNLQLRQVSKQSGIKPMEVASIGNAGKEPKKIDAWIQSIKDLHVGKPPPVMSYSKNMPEIESLMQEWPGDMEDLLNQVRLPSGNLDIDISTLTKVFCNLMDIPVYEGKSVESLHVLFTLYLEFKNNPFLKAQAAQQAGGMNMMGMSTMGSQQGDGMMSMQYDGANAFMNGGMSTMQRDGTM